MPCVTGRGVTDVIVTVTSKQPPTGIYLGATISFSLNVGLQQRRPTPRILLPE